jgi:saccharopine dehydrogenase-like NADP-dependent oxidoreductase
MSRFPVLIVGASGVFGSRLAMLLAVSKRYRILLGGRSREKASEIAKRILAKSCARSRRK